MADFKLIEIPTGISVRWPVASSVAGALMFNLLLFQIPSFQMRTQKPSHPEPSHVSLIDPNNTIYLGRAPAVAAPKPKPPTAAVPPATPKPLAEIPPVIPKPPVQTVQPIDPKHIPMEVDPQTPVPDESARLSISFAPDAGQRLAGLLQLYNGTIGFCAGSTLTDVYEPRGGEWVAANSISAPLTDYYPLLISEQYGGYSFLNQLRSVHRELSGRIAYALFPPEVQLRIERGILSAKAPPQCGPGEHLEAVVSLSAGGFDLESLSCRAVAENGVAR